MENFKSKENLSESEKVESAIDTNKEKKEYKYDLTITQEKKAEEARKKIKELMEKNEELAEKSEKLKKDSENLPT